MGEEKDAGKTSAGKRLSRLMADNYTALHQRAAEGAFVVWIAINVPAELFLGFDNVVYGVPESHAATCAGKGAGVELCEKAEQQGYSMDLCAYARIDLGCVAEGGKGSPTMGLPRPDLLVSNNNNCSLLVKWFDVHHRTLGVPHFLLDVPFCYQPQREKDRAYIVGQLRDLIRAIEQLSGQRFDMERARDAFRHTYRGLGHWKRFLRCAEARPSGITAFDSFVQMAPILTLRGTPAFEEHYRILADETRQRLDAGQVPVPDERYRLFWDNIAPWHQLRSMSSRLASMGANIVGASYTSCIGSVEGDFGFYEYNGEDPLEYFARTMNCYLCPHGMELRGRAMTAALKKLDVDGVVFASNRSCKPYSITQLDQQRRLAAAGIPSVMIDVDHADARQYSEETAFTRIEALLETIEAGGRA